MRLTFHAAADAEVTEAARYYEMQVEKLGVSFLGELNAVLERIETHPQAALWLEKKSAERLCGVSRTAFSTWSNPNGSESSR